MKAVTPLRVLMISDVYFPRVNGVSTSIRSFRADLAAAGVESVLVVPAYTDHACADEAGVVRVPSAHVPKDPEDRRMRWGALLRTLRDLSATQRFDVVHIQTPFIAHYAGVRIARRLGLPVLATYHTFFEEYLHHYVPALPRPLGRALARRFTRSQCGQLDALVAPSAPLRDTLLSYGVRTPMYVIPTGLPPDRFRAGDGARFRAAHGIAAKRPLLLYVGRVAHEKNIGFLVEAFAELRHEAPEALLVIAGEGPARRALGEQVTRLGLERDVRFIGYLDRDTALLDCYASADAFVFASRTETQGLVLLEAMAQGRPVVSTAHLGTVSVLQPGCGAEIVADDVDEFARGVLRVLDHPGRATQAGARGREYATGWSSAAMVWRLTELYRELVAGAAQAAADPRQVRELRQPT
jgi:1,2-diacylglycerol 3-alpha-glucosyltransferase